MEPMLSIQSKSVVLPVADVDTDQIIPARFLTTTSREGLADGLFYDWRYREDGSENPDFVINRPEAADCTILVADRNFGCGSSREHAPWALTDFGFRAVISSEFADIFRSNALKNGLLPVIVDTETLKWLLGNPGAELAIDVARSTLTLPDGRSVTYPIDAFSRYCLLEGIDQLGYLLKQRDRIYNFEQARAWKP